MQGRLAGLDRRQAGPVFGTRRDLAQLQQRWDRALAENVIVILTRGAAVGQINGIALYDLVGYSWIAGPERIIVSWPTMLGYSTLLLLAAGAAASALLLWQVREREPGADAAEAGDGERALGRRLELDLAAEELATGDRLDGAGDDEGPFRGPGRGGCGSPGCGRARACRPGSVRPFGQLPHGGHLLPGAVPRGQALRGSR